jgi:hypothetical protein
MGRMAHDPSVAAGDAINTGTSATTSAAPAV